MKGHIVQRSKNSWSVSIYQGIDQKTGKKKYKWYTIKGTKRDAEKFANERIHEIENGIIIDSKHMTLGQYINYWYQECCITKLSPTTYESYKRNIDNYIIPYLGNIKLENLMPLQLQSFYSNLSGILSNTTIRYIHRILHSALNRAMKWDLIARNVADNVEPPRKQKYKPTILNSTQVGELIIAVKDTFIYLPVMIAISTGMRRGEVLGLTWENADLDEGILHIVQAIYPTKKGLQVLPPKSACSIRDVSIPPTLVSLLKEYKKISKSKYVCVNDNGDLISPSSLNHKFRDVLLSNNLPPIRFHDLRHSHASLLVTQGVQPKVISERLGHSSINITMDIYSHVYEETNFEVANNFDSFLKATQ